MDKLAPNIQLFEASPATVQAGQSTTLRFNVTEAATVRIDIMNGANVLPDSPDTENEVSSPALEDTTTFVLTAVGPTGKNATASLTVLVQKEGGAPTITSFNANPATLEAGGTTTLTWQIENAASARIEVAGTTLFTAPSDAVANGTFQHTPAQTTTYTLVAASADGMETRGQVTVTVNGAMPVIRSFRANPPTIDPGMSSTLDWEVGNAIQIDIVDDLGTSVYSGSDLESSITVSPTATTRYTLTASDGTNQVTQSVVVSVNQMQGATIVSFTANPQNAFTGQDVTLEWEVQDAPDGVEIRVNGALLVASPLTSGTYMVQPQQTTTYTLVALNPIGNATQTVTVNVTVPNGPTILSFTANPNPVGVNTMTTLSWRTLVSTRVRVLQGANVLLDTTTMVAQGTLQVTPTADTTYTLEASDATQTSTMNLRVFAHPTPTIVSFTATPTVLNGPTQVTVSWNVMNYATLMLTQGGAPVPGFSVPTSTASAINNQGSVTVTVNQPTLFELTATSAGGTDTAQAQVGTPIMGAETEPNDDIATANPFDAGGTVTGMIGQAGDVDYYRIMVPAGGSVRAETSDGQGGCATDTILFLFDSNGTALTGNDDDGGTPPCSLIDPTVDAAATNLDAGTYYIAVAHFDDVAGTGAYTLEIRIDGPVCGNTIVEGNEQCDAGDLTNGDGCSSTCMLEINPTVISGTGGNVTLTIGPNAFAVVRVDVLAGQAVTATAADAGGTTCNNVDTALNFGDSQFLLVGGKADGGPTGTAGNCAAIYYPADAFATDLAAGSYYLVVFNEGAAQGTVQLRVGILNAICGNGAFETRTEQCDDGNLTNGDLCDANCDLEIASTVTIPAANPVTFAGALNAPAFADLLRIDVTGDHYLTVETFAPNQAGGCAGGTDTVVALYSSTLQLLGGDDDNGTNACSFFDELAPFARVTTGTYYLGVFDYQQNSAVPSYEVVISSTPVGTPAPTVEVEDNGTQAAAQSTGLNGAGSATMHGQTDPSGDDDVYSFVVPANRTVMVSARTYDQLGQPTSCTASRELNDTRIFLEEAGMEATGPNTVELAFSDDVDPAANLWCSSIAATPVTTGATPATFFVRVQGFDDVGQHFYFLDITVQ